VPMSSGVPFVVRTGSVTTRVLGTTFGIRKYPTDRETRVTVTAGKVTTSGRAAHIVVTAGMMAQVTDSTVTSMTIDAETATSWTRSVLVFHDAAVSTVLAELGEWYGYNFRIEDTSVTRRHVTATFKLSTFGETLEDLGELLDVTMSVRDTIVTLRPRRSARRTINDKSNVHEQWQPSREVGR